MDVLMRTMQISPPSYTITYVEYSLLYFTMCAAPYLARTKKHIVIESFVTILPSATSKVIEKIVCISCCAASLTIFVISVQLFHDAWMSGAMDTRGIDIPLWILYLPMPPCFFLLGVEFLRMLCGGDTVYRRESTPGGI